MGLFSNRRRIKNSLQRALFHELDMLNDKLKYLEDHINAGFEEMYKKISILEEVERFKHSELKGEVTSLISMTNEEMRKIYTVVYSLSEEILHHRRDEK